MNQEIDLYKAKNFTGTNYRLLEEWEAIFNRFENNKEINVIIRERNASGLPVVFEVIYKITSFCGVMEKDEDGLEKPIFAHEFIMRIYIPNNYPSVDSKLVFRFMTENIRENKIRHPWHPNIRYYGDFVGRVCLNNVAYGTYTDLALYIEKVALYLKYEKYHAVNEPPFPEDNKVADWVINQAEPNGWIDDLVKSYDVTEIRNVERSQ
jgi:hypothetical protein